MWEAHYLLRAIVYPYRLRDPGKPMPLAVVASGFVFTTVNGILNGHFVAASEYGDVWLSTPAFVAGASLFVLGFAVNQLADARLLRLRERSETTYMVPRGGLFRYVSCPNYLGEIVEWCGFAVASGTLAGLSFALWTVANLLPRALAHHRFYRQTFRDYPSERKALIPFVL
jgi:steroid 5-alpha reductase family enzyme